MAHLSFVQTRARRTDSATSHDAAKAAVTRKADMERAAITNCIRGSKGLTAREVSALIGLDYVETQRRDGCAVWKV